MRNIYEDGTMPGTDDVPEIRRQPKVPTRPKKQLSLTDKQQEKLTQQQSPPQNSYQPMPPYGYVPVSVPQEGQTVVYQAPMGGMPQPYYPVTPQSPQGVYPYAPYMPVGVQPPVVPEQPGTPKTQNPGTRVLYQSPDFDQTEGEPGANPQVGAGFYKENLKQQPVITQEEIEVEEISLEQEKKIPEIMKSAPAFYREENVTVDDVDIKALEEKAKPQKPEAAPKGKKKKPLAKTEIIRRVVLSVSIVAIIIASGMLINEYRLSKENEELMKEVSDLIIEEEPTTKKKKPSENKEETTQPQLTPEQQWAQIRQEYPNVIFPANIQLKYAKLYAENQDFVGYLSADGVGLNLPVVQTDNDEEYLNKNFYGRSTKYGCPFVTHLNNLEPFDMNTVIFGHHMNDGTVFGALDEYKSIEGFKKAPVISFNTASNNYDWKIIAAFITNDSPSDDNGYVFRYYFTNLSTQERFAAYLNELAQRSLYDTGVDVLPTDKLLTLSTCSHEFEDARFVVVARLVRPGETSKVDTTRATVNSSPRYPQAYYNAKRIKTNPYKNASRWEVG